MGSISLLISVYALCTFVVVFVRAPSRDQELLGRVYWTGRTVVLLATALLIERLNTGVACFLLIASVLGMWRGYRLIEASPAS